MRFLKLPDIYVITDICKHFTFLYLYSYLFEKIKKSLSFFLYYISFLKYKLTKKIQNLLEQILAWSLFFWPPVISGKPGEKGLDIASINAISVDNHNLHKRIDQLFYHNFGSIVSSEEKGDYLKNICPCDMSKKIYFCHSTHKYFAPVKWKLEFEKIMEILRKVK